ncbi:MSCRAMM family protein [Varibaculum cambriense]|uniref:SpaA-like prealbumin fold domain-containing protein n=11 Tax=root TaxID=1 RepID=A0AAJ1EXW8_9ACTO|nr:hypothetical protein [Varibaculum cambriense]
MNGKNADLNTADNDIQPSQLAADHGNTGTATSESGKVSVLNRRTLGVASVLGLLFASLLAGTLFFTSADDSASPAPKVDANTVSDNTVSAHAQIKPAEFSTANSFYHSVLDPVNVSASPKAGRALAASRNQGAAETSAAQSTSANSARSQCSGAACLSPRRAPVATGVKLKLFKLGVADSATVTRCTRSRLCTAADGEIVGGARFALYEGRTVDETKLIDTYTVGEGGFELPGLQAGKNYTLKEVAAPAGYILNPNSYTLMVGADGRVGYRTGKIIRYPNGEFYIPNLKAPVPEVWLFKLGVADLAVCSWGSCSADVAGSEILGGATFALYEGTAADEAHKVGETFTVGQDGLKIPGLQVGKTYTLKEVAAPENYDINPATYTFEVDADGKAKYQTDNGSEFFVDNKIYFPNKKAAPPAVKLKLFKLGVADSALVRKCMTPRTWCSAGDGELVAGAKFALYKGSVSEANKVGEYTVGKDGLELSGLQQGANYTLKEVEAPAGYELNPDTTVFKVFADGKVGGLNGKRYKYFDNNEFYFPNLKAPVPEVWLFKLGVADLAVCSWGSCSADVAGSEILGGATFALYEGTAADEAHKVGETFTVGQDGLKIPGLQVGKTYTLKEVAAPENYDINPATYTFEVDADGKAKYQTDNGSEFFVDNKIYFPNQKKAAPPAVKLRLFKLGVADSATVTRCTRSRLCTAADGEIVGGARFALYEGRTVDETKLIDTYTVGEGGFELPGLQAGKNYTLKEVAAPAGYILNPNSYTLMVGADGRVGYRTGKIIRYPNGEFYIPNLKVQTIDISLNKVSDKDTPLENVKFDLYEADNPDKPLQNITTGNDGKANLTVMPGGKYRLVETATAPGYALLPQAIEFQVDANGTVTIDKQNGNVNTVTGGDKTLKVVNYPEGKLPLSGQSGFLVVLLSGLSLLLVGVAISLVGRKRN